MIHKEYLGDGVYVHYDGYHIVLSKKEEADVYSGCSIFLDSAVFSALTEYEKRMRQ